MRRTLWSVAKWVALAATIGVVAGLWIRPRTTLLVLWSVIIPLVPASLLITPKAWRNVCPLATLNLLTAGRFGRRTQSPAFATGANTLGIVLLAAMVPARHFIFNVDGPALAITILAVAAAALLLGTLYDAKAGFCNAICPVLPVERLYGQSPLMTIDNPRCTPCTACVRACVDVSPDRNALQILGRSRHSSEWLRSPFGIFAAAFPGFVVGYFTVADGPLSTAGAVYLNVLLWAAASYALVAMVVAMTGSRIGVVLPSIAALAAALYYWFAAPGMVSVFGGADAAAAGLRVVALALIFAWWWRSRSAGRATA
jgi:nitrite reductase (NADH) large subunit